MIVLLNPDKVVLDNLIFNTKVNAQNKVCAINSSYQAYHIDHLSYCEDVPYDDWYAVLKNCRLMRPDWLETLKRIWFTHRGILSAMVVSERDYGLFAEYGGVVADRYRQGWIGSEQDFFVPKLVDKAPVVCIMGDARILPFLNKEEITGQVLYCPQVMVSKYGNPRIS